MIWRWTYYMDRTWQDGMWLWSVWVAAVRAHPPCRPIPAAGASSPTRRWPLYACTIPYQHANHHGCFCWLCRGPSSFSPRYATAAAAIRQICPWPTVQHQPSTAPRAEHQQKPRAQLVPNCTLVWILVTPCMPPNRERLKISFSSPEIQ
jgi:hypothetical protein